MTCGLVTAMMLTAASVSADRVTIGTEADFPPYTQLDPSGEVVGFDRDVGDEVCRRAQLDCEWRTADFDRLIPGVMAGEFDLVISALASTPERERLVDFSDPYLGGGGSDQYLGYPGAPEPARARIGVQSGTIHADHLENTGRRFIAFTRSGDLIGALVGRKIDLAFGGWDTVYLGELAATHGIEPLYEEEVEAGDVVMAVCKGNHVLLGQVNTAIAGMWNDGTIEHLSARWFTP